MPYRLYPTSTPNAGRSREFPLFLRVEALSFVLYRFIVFHPEATEPPQQLKGDSTMNLNRVELMGFLGADPEVRTTPTSKVVTNFRIGVTRRWKNRQSGESQEQTEWIRLVAWEKLGEVCGQYLKKGSHVYIEGRLQTRSWDDAQVILDGKPLVRYTTEVVVTSMKMLDRRPEDGTVRNGSTGSNGTAKAAPRTATRRNPEIVAAVAEATQPELFDSEEDFPF